MKPGIKTTEFWMALVVAIGGIASAAFSDRTWAQVLGVVGAALASMGYGFSRATIKKSVVMSEAARAVLAASAEAIKKGDQ